MTDKVDPMTIPYHELKRRAGEVARENGFVVKNTYKKKDLIFIIQNECDPHPKQEKPKAPVLQDSKKEACIPMIPEEIKDDLMRLKERGLEWDIDEESGCVNFMRDIPTCANLDQSATNILRTAKEAFGKQRPVEVGNPILWGN